jgi:hypothetical protein
MLDAVDEVFQSVSFACQNVGYLPCCTSISVVLSSEIVKGGIDDLVEKTINQTVRG